MIEVIHDCAEHARQPLVRGMFADRKRLFIDLYGWDLPASEGRYEVDQYDTADTLYIIVANEAGEHDASIRLMPTTVPHMLADIFPHLCPTGVPVGPDIWESSRVCLPQRHGAEGRRVAIRRKPPCGGGEGAVLRVLV